MTPERMNAKLAEWNGWEHHDHSPQGVGSECWATWTDPNGNWFMVPPNYCSCLNAVRELELKLRAAPGTYQPGGIYHYVDELRKLAGVDSDCDFNEGDVFEFMTATPQQRCEALLRTLGLWEDE